MRHCRAVACRLRTSAIGHADFFGSCQNNAHTFANMLTDEMRYRLMRVLLSNPEMSQRDLARELGVSLGRVNYCLQALIRAGLVKARNFSNSRNKTAYMYLVTSRGIRQKTKLTVRFLKAKIQEYEALRAEIAEIQREITTHRDRTVS
jgi:EPS-associated MarR family transcriptional regulator